MKLKITSFFILLFLTVEVIGQTFNYQVVIRGSSGDILSNHTVGIELKLYKGNPTTSGTVIYTETHTITTNTQGVISLSVGKGITSDIFSDINWNARNHWLETSVDIAGGTNYVVIGASELQSVPYANYAAKSGDKVFSTIANVTSNASGAIATDDFVFGSTQLDNDPTTTDDNSKFFFDKSKAAFRLGRLIDLDPNDPEDNELGDQWNDSNVGEESIAMGRGSIVAGRNSVAIGNVNNIDAKSRQSMTFGERNRVINSTSAFAIGDDNELTHSFSMAIGTANKATAFGGIATGFLTYSGSYGETAIGLANTQVDGAKEGFTATDRLFVIGNGRASFQRSDALVMLKNGNTTLNGQLTIDGDNQGTGASYTLPAQDGTVNQVMTTDGAGNVSWGNASGGSFSTTSNVTSNASGTIATDDFVFGSNQLANDATTNDDDHRMFFDKSKAAFRVGVTPDDLSEGAVGNQWEDANVGYASFAAGIGSVASGTEAIALGRYHTATGGNSVAIGSSNQTTTGGSIAIGASNIASGVASIAIGDNVSTSSRSQISLGINNVPLGGSDFRFIATDPLLVIGNGTLSTQSNALVMLKNGNTTLNGSLTIDADNTGVGRGYTLPAQDGTANQVMATDGAGNVTWVNYGLEAVSSPTFGSGWQNYSVVHGNGFEDARYYVDNGRVYLGGLIRKTFGITAGEVMLTLPVGYRPQKQRIFTVSTEAGIVRIDVAANGNVVFNGPAHNGGQNWVSLDGISFRVD